MFKKLLFLSYVFWVSINFLRSQPLDNHTNKHFLTTSDSSPFFWLADTGWELFHRLDRGEAERYIKKRKAQGFNIIQAVALHELQAFETPNAYDDFPLIEENIDQLAITEGNDPTNATAYDYWDHVKYILQVAKENDMIIGLLPCWGEYVTPRKRGRTIATIEQGYNFGHFIGDWLKEYNDNIVWILGGDRLPDEKPNGVAIWRAMAEGITDAINGEKQQDNKADYTKTFMTYHCYAPSTIWFAEDDWIDMHTWGSYHEKKDNERAFYISWAEWEHEHYKPFVNSEPAYENLPINYDWANVSNGRFDDFDVRQIAYWSVFSGCAGHTYGAHEVWMMHKVENENLPLTSKLENEWEAALEYKGAQEMKYLKELMLSIDFFSRKPDIEIIADNPNDSAGRLIACSGDGYSMIYTPTGKRIAIHIDKLPSEKFSSVWFNPRNGERSKAMYTTKGDTLEFKPVGKIERGNDWVLIILAE